MIVCTVEPHVQYGECLLFSVQFTFKFSKSLGLSVSMQAMLIYYIVLCRLDSALFYLRRYYIAVSSGPNNRQFHKTGCSYL